MRVVGVILVSLIILLAGYPIAMVLTHGYDLRLWPSEATYPHDWIAYCVRSWGKGLVDTYIDMLAGRSTVLAGGGPVEAFVILGVICLTSGIILTPKAPEPRRDPNRTHGDARFATPRERSNMRAGLELGLDPSTGRPVRVAVKGNLVSIAPPRTGKTSGLIIPNLAAPEGSAWFGPAVVLDPKGEAYRATAARRRALGRSVRCLDPMGIAGGEDSWNPLSGLGDRLIKPHPDSN